MIIMHGAGNSDIGIGHLSRINSLALEFNRLNIRVMLVLEAPKLLVTEIINSTNNIYIAEDREDANEYIKKVTKEGEFIVYITDLLDLGFEQRKFSDQCKFKVRVHLNDSNISEYIPDIWINGDAFRNPSNSLFNHGKTTGLMGPAYSIIRKEIVNVRPLNRKVVDEIKKILISFGGADPGKYTEYFLGDICVRYPSVQFNVVIGPAFSDHRIHEIVNNFTGVSNVDLLIKPQGLENLIISSDVFISLGGISAYEAMCLGCPVIAVQWKGMSSYVEKMDEKGFISSLGNIEDVIETLPSVLVGTTLLQKKAEYAWRLIDGRGVERVASSILQYT
ncbi:glycosyltransferase [Paenibacillus sp. FSL M7-0656]|uniref:glycosyltransferase n=1 Tax=Paenibacillus sp. FSL M7-0656 TaxID=2921534 RepID=UPI0030F5F8B6